VKIENEENQFKMENKIPLKKPRTSKRPKA
jgi:hypothetical protein